MRTPFHFQQNLNIVVISFLLTSIVSIKNVQSQSPLLFELCDTTITIDQQAIQTVTFGNAVNSLYTKGINIESKPLGEVKGGQFGIESRLATDYTTTVGSSLARLGHIQSWNTNGHLQGVYGHVSANRLTNSAFRSTLLGGHFQGN